MYYGLPWVEAGGLMFYGVSYAEMFRRAAHLADRILKGASPAELPIEHPPHFELHINLKTAQDLGLKIPLRFRWGDPVLPPEEMMKLS
jgi:putative ABC transport system substrate-binding protein